MKRKTNPPFIPISTSFITLFGPGDESDIQLPHRRSKTVATLLRNRASVLTLRKRDFKRADKVSYHAAHFHHGQLLTDTAICSKEEREKRALVKDGVGVPGRPALWHESERVRPVAWVTLEAGNGRP